MKHLDRAQSIHRIALLTAISSLVMARYGLALQTAQGAPGTSGRGASALVVDRVTVIDVERGHLRPDQRVVIVGNRIQAVGRAGAIRLPPGAQVVAAQGKYLIPGLWDMHTHPRAERNYRRYIAMGVTGIRRLQTDARLDTLIQWRREILAGRRVGPPRQVLTGPALNGGLDDEYRPDSTVCRESGNDYLYFCANALGRARQVVDSLQAAGADMLKTYNLSPALYFAVAKEARQRGILFGGHITTVSAIDASDSGARIIDHLFPTDREDKESGGLAALCYKQQATIASCQPVAERFRRNDTWWVPTAFISLASDTTDRGVGGHSRPVIEYASRLIQKGAALWASDLFKGGSNWLSDSVRAQAASALSAPKPKTNSMTGRDGIFAITERVGLPIAAGTDDGFDGMAGWALHAELATYAAEGVSPLHALQSATLNPAKLLHVTDSLGTVAAGKLADLVLLDANPLADITNTTTIRAVIANGRYFDRAALDSLVAETGSHP